MLHSLTIKAICLYKKYASSPSASLCALLFSSNFTVIFGAKRFTLLICCVCSQHVRTYQGTSWCQIRRGAWQTHDMGTCVNHPSATALVCTSRDHRTILDYGPWHISGCVSLSVQEIYNNLKKIEKEKSYISYSIVTLRSL